MFRRPVCGAQLRGKPGLRCQQSPMAGRRRCRLHGGKAGRPPGYPMHANTAFALRDGRARWIARTRAAKEAEAAMLNDTLLAKTQRLLQAVMAKKNRRVRPAWLMTKVGTLPDASDLAVAVVMKIFKVGADPNDTTLRTRIHAMALQVFSRLADLYEIRIKQRPDKDWTERYREIADWKQWLIREQRLVLGLADPGASQMTEQEDNPVCLWCGKSFTPRITGGAPQIFCCQPCRRAFDTAGRAWVLDAARSRQITVAERPNGERALTLGVPPPDDTEPTELLDDLLMTLLLLPGDTWSDIALALPDKLFDRIDRWLAGLLDDSQAAGGAVKCAKARNVRSE